MLNEASRRLRSLRDPAIPAMPELLGPGAHDLLSAVLATEAELLKSWDVAGVTWRPGRYITVRYAVATRAGVNTQVVAFAGESLPERALQLGRDRQRVALWRVDGDPALPGLRALHDEAALRSTLAKLGLERDGATLRLRAYRPLRRAVVQVDTPRATLFVKAVRPGEAPALHERHRELAATLPVPRSLSWSGEHGMVVLEALTGTTLRDLFACLGAVLPPVSALERLLDALPGLAGPQPASPVEDARQHSRLLRRIFPEATDRLRELNQTLAGLDRDPGPLTTAHGDFYEAQLLARGGAITGLLDLDTLGPGHRIDDWATMVGHLAVLGQSRMPTARDYAREVLSLADRACDPVTLRARIAAVITGLATGPFRVQSPEWPAETNERIELAEAWARSALEAAGLAGPHAGSSASGVK